MSSKLLLAAPFAYFPIFKNPHGKRDEADQIIDLSEKQETGGNDRNY